MNEFPGTVTSIKSGRLLTEIELTTNTGLKIAAVITTDSLGSLGVVPGSKLVARIPDSSILLIKAESAGPPPSHAKAKPSFEIANVQTSGRNKFLCRILDIAFDSIEGVEDDDSAGAVVAQIKCEIQPHGGGTIVGGGEKLSVLVTAGSVDSLRLAKGQFVWAVCKAFAVTLFR